MNDKVNDGGWTPGPWSAEGALVFCEQVHIASAWNRPVNDARADGESWLGMRERTEPERAAARAEEIANARLIAAAPDLAEALQSVEAYLADREDVVDGDYGQPAPNEEMTLLREVRAALAKARGAQ